MDDTAESRRRASMATPQKDPLRAVTLDEQTALERLVRRSSERLDRVRWATAVLAVAEGQGFAAAARQAGFGSSMTVAQLVARFNRRGLALLWRDQEGARCGPRAAARVGKAIRA